MGVSTNAQISFGYVVGDDSFPWDDRELYEDGIEDWWVHGVCGMDDWDGDDHTFNTYYDEKKKHLATLPVTLVNACSSSYPYYILAAKDSVQTVFRGYPKPLRQESLSPEQVTALREFVELYNIDVGDDGPQWLLSSFWES